LGKRAESSKLKVRDKDRAMEKLEVGIRNGEKR
jgi:hypothetical protein